MIHNFQLYTNFFVYKFHIIIIDRLVFYNKVHLLLSEAEQTYIACIIYDLQMFLEISYIYMLSMCNIILLKQTLSRDTKWLRLLYKHLSHCSMSRIIL